MNWKDFGLQVLLLVVWGMTCVNADALFPVMDEFHRINWERVGRTLVGTQNSESLVKLGREAPNVDPLEVWTVGRVYIMVLP